MTEQDGPITKQNWTGRWCWTRKHLSLPWNTYVYFRKVVELPDKPQSATVRISADARYTLYVNGKRIHQGPARSYPQFQSYDTLDLTVALTTGKNTLCAIVHQFGIPTFQSVFRDISGFLLDGVIDVAGSQVPLHTPDGWLCRTATAWRKDVTRTTIQLGFQEHFDANADPAHWMTPDYPAAEDQTWKPPFDVGPVGCHPWLTMHERALPLLAQHIESFQAVLCQFSGENARGYKIAEDVYHLPAQEPRKRGKNLLENPSAMLRDDSDLTTIPPPPDGQFTMVVLDLGQIRAGHLMLDIADAAGDEIIDTLFTEELDKSGAPFIVESSICEEATANRYRCRPGPQRYEPFHFMGLRYATLIFRNLPKPLKLRHVALRQVHAAIQDIGSFECSDERLNRIWRVARETQRNCMFDAYVDCPWREQAQWWGDARVQFRVNAYAFGDVSLFERGIRQVAQSQAPDGSLHSHPPADAPLHRLPDYMMTWVGSLWDHYFHTGQTDLLRECAPAMHRVLDFLAAHEVRDGLVGDFDGYWVFLDWQNLYKANFSGVLNLMYLQALRWASVICSILGDTTSSNAYNRKATALQSSVEKYFWNPKAKLWRDGFDAAKNQPVEETSQQVTALAMLLHLKPEAHPALAREVLLKSAKSKRTKILTASPFFYAYVLDALAESGFRTEAVELISDKWGQMLDQGATTFWEIWEPTPTTSRCHAWSASPLYHLSQQVLGVMPVDIGWKQIRIAPLPGKLEFAKGIVPSPLGLIRVEWEKAGDDQLAVRVDLPPGIEAEFVSPPGEIRTLESGSHEFHT
ncbi:MAG: trehalase family glycosidase [Planctomycetota bacterium]|nr:trehalase family glycosidase [Planctomycetota bacterium]